LLEKMPDVRSSRQHREGVAAHQVEPQKLDGVPQKLQRHDRAQQVMQKARPFHPTEQQHQPLGPGGLGKLLG